MSKLSILQVSPFFSPNVGGVETHLDDLLQFLNKRKINNTVITYQALVGKQKGVSYETRAGSEIYRVSWLRGLLYKTEKYPLLHFIYLTPFLALKSLLLMKKVGKRINIIHTHGINALAVGFLVKKFFNKPLIVSLHVEFNLPRKNLSTQIILFLLKQADYILVLTNRSQKQLVEFGIDAQKILIFSYWSNQQIFKPQNKLIVKRSLKWDQRLSILFVGRLINEKGVNLLLNVAKKMPNLKFFIAGTGELDGQVRNAASIYKNIVYLGRVANDKLGFYYNAADILIVPSLVKNPKPRFTEGIPRVIIEAMHCGLPIIGTDNGGIKEMIIKSKAGKVCESTTNGLISAIKYLSNASIMKRCQEHARQYALKKFTQKNGYIISKVYEKMVMQTQSKSRLEELLKNTGDMALKRRARRIIEELNPRSGDKILEVGCGDGYYLHLLSNLGLKFNLTGVDIDQSALRIARRNLNGKRITLVNADLMKKLPFPDNSFDQIMMSEVAEHLPNDRKGLIEVYRVLKPNGILCLTVPHAKYPLLWDPINWILEHLFNFHIKSGFWAGIWNQHIRLYKLNQICSILTATGFTIEQSQIQTYWCIPFNHYIINLGARLIANNHVAYTIKKAMSKFSSSNRRSVSLIDICFQTVNLIDKLNILMPIKSSGVTIFIKVRK